MAQIDRQSNNVEMLMLRLSEAQRRLALLTREISSIRALLPSAEDSSPNDPAPALPDVANVSAGESHTPAPNVIVTPPTTPTRSEEENEQLFSVLVSLEMEVNLNSPRRARRIRELSPGRRHRPYLANGSRHAQSIPKRSNNNARDDPKSRPNRIFIVDDGYTVVYANGFCQNNGRFNARAGLGVFFGLNNVLNISNPVSGKATCNTAEIQACLYAINTAHQNGIKKLKIRTASDYIMNVMTVWIHKWKDNNWKLCEGGNVKNKEDILKLEKACEQLGEVYWEFVEMCTETRGSAEADKLARAGVVPYEPKYYSDF